ncbi:MAG: shikimate kinase [Candidatus Marinimicrobia bacterium]|jgi:shikimate kinase|nr:shikimate kinase [Candidatus Neomarinimicrobiota bacterium]
MNYFLIGMMGSGKTSLGKSLANDIDYNFIDLDGEIEKVAGIKINNIFDKYGEKYFRKLEVEISRKVIRNSENNVIATGGGFPINENNFKWMKNIGTIIWLKASTETIFKRIRLSKDRPLLTNPSIQSIEGILSKRMKYYQRAKYHIDTNGKSLNTAVNTLIKEIKNNSL